MNTSSYVLFISTVIVLVIGDMSFDPTFPDRLNALVNSGTRKSEPDENDTDDDSEVRTMSLNMSMPELYELCKTYNQSNPAGINSQLRKAIPENGMSKKTRNDINMRLESSCSTLREKYKNIVEAHQMQNLAKQNLTASLTRPGKSQKINQDKAKMLGKPSATYTVTDRPSENVPTQGSVSKSVPVRRESESGKSGDVPPEEFPSGPTSGSIPVVTIPGHKAVQKPGADIDPPAEFPNMSEFPEYDLANLTELENKVLGFMEKVKLIVTHNKTHNDIHDRLEVISVINQLKMTLDQWSHSHHNATGDSDIIDNETMNNKLIESKLYLARLVHELIKNQTDPTDLTCKINALFDEIQNMTTYDFFRLSVDPNDRDMICNGSYRFNCTYLIPWYPPLEYGILNLKFRPNTIAVLAICFAAVSVLSYGGLIYWRYFLERRYGTRQLLRGEEFDEAAPDVFPFDEMRTAEL